jgi:FMN-dependent NADH-azoreductase
MSTLLQIHTSLFGAAGASSALAPQFVAQWQREHPAGVVLTRDLSGEPLPHLAAAQFQAFLTAPEARTPEQRALVAPSDALIEELQRAEVIVLAVPMYNFGVPSTLRAYFDHVGRAGHTFRYTADGPEGLLKGKKVYVFATRGGRYAGTPGDAQSSYLRTFLGFVGLSDVTFVYAEGLALGAQQREAALGDARRAIAGLAPAEAAA